MEPAPWTHNAVRQMQLNLRHKVQQHRMSTVLPEILCRLKLRVRHKIQRFLLSTVLTENLSLQLAMTVMKILKGLLDLFDQ